MPDQSSHRTQVPTVGQFEDLTQRIQNLERSFAAANLQQTAERPEGSTPVASAAASPVYGSSGQTTLVPSPSGSPRAHPLAPAQAEPLEFEELTEEELAPIKEFFSLVVDWAGSYTSTINISPHAREESARRLVSVSKDLVLDNSFSSTWSYLGTRKYIIAAMINRHFTMYIFSESHVLEQSGEPSTIDRIHRVNEAQRNTPINNHAGHCNLSLAKSLVYQMTAENPSYDRWRLSESSGLAEDLTALLAPAIAPAVRPAALNALSNIIANAFKACFALRAKTKRYGIYFERPGEPFNNTHMKVIDAQLAGIENFSGRSDEYSVALSVVPTIIASSMTSGGRHVGMIYMGEVMVEGLSRERALDRNWRRRNEGRRR